MLNDLLPKPLPLIESGKYPDNPTPQWRVKTVPSALDSLPYSLQLKYQNSNNSQGTLVFKAQNPSTLEDMQTNITKLLNSTKKPPEVDEVRGFLKFSSFLESGNLDEVYALDKQEYNLFLRPDTNTKGQTQWFYFCVEPLQVNSTAKFNICNIKKPVKLYKKGFKPLYCLEHSVEWKVVSGGVDFHRNNTLSASKSYNLSFSFNFSENRRVFFAFSEPYTYSMMLSFLGSMEANIGAVDQTLYSKDLLYRRNTLCKSLAGLSLYTVELTAPKKKGLSISKRKAVVISARVHAGETCGSWVMQGVLEFLTSDSPKAKHLLENYIFYLVPMLNPDGVVCGNSRCSLMGVDLNRRWENPSALTHPPIYYFKQLLHKVSSKREVLMFCDLHAHSKKENCFIYGCNLAASGGFTSWTKVRLFPKVFASMTPFFSYPDCKFKVEPEKQGTGRVVVWKEFSVTNSFTLESSFHAFQVSGQTYSFKNEDYKDIGSKLLTSLYEYTHSLKSIEFELKINGGWLKPGRLNQLAGCSAQQKLQKEIEQARKYTRSQPSKKRNSKQIEVKDWRSYFTSEELEKAYEKVLRGEDDEEIDSSGSDSCPSEDNLEGISIQFHKTPERPVRTSYGLQRPGRKKYRSLKSCSSSENLNSENLGRLKVPPGPKTEKHPRNLKNSPCNRTHPHRIMLKFASSRPKTTSKPSRKLPIPIDPAFKRQHFMSPLEVPVLDQRKNKRKQRPLEIRSTKLQGVPVHRYNPL